MSGAVYWIVACWEATNSSTVWDVLLSNLWSWGLYPASCQISVCLFVCLKEFLFGAIFDGYRGNEIGVVYVKDDGVRMATI